MQNNQVAIITGASRGIGREVALNFARQGVNVALIARNEAELQDLEQEIEQEITIGEVLVLPADILDEQAIQQAVGKVWETWGRIDLLVNNAGIGVFKTVADTTLEEWEAVMNTNAKGTFLCTKHCLEYLKKQNSGHIITIASDVARRNFAHGGVYCASKYAQDALMQVVRQEAHAFGVKVSTIYPGLTETYFHNQTPSETPDLNRLQASDVAEAVRYIFRAPAHVVIDELFLHPFAQKYWQS